MSIRHTILICGDVLCRSRYKNYLPHLIATLVLVVCVTPAGAAYSLDKVERTVVIEPDFSHHPCVVVAPDGDLLVFYKLGSERSPSPLCMRRSKDKGTSWGARKNVLPQPGNDAYVTPFASTIDGKIYLTAKIWTSGSENYLYAHIYESSDNGATWAKKGTVNNGKNEAYCNASSVCKAKNGDFLIAAFGSDVPWRQKEGFKPKFIRVHRSTDRGRTWKEDVAFESGNGHSCLRYAPNGDLLMANAGGGALYTSTDDGRTWERTHNGLGALGAPWLAVLGNTIWYMNRMPVDGDGGGAFGTKRSTDNGVAFDARPRIWETWQGRHGDCNHFHGVFPDNTRFVAVYYHSKDGEDQVIKSKVIRVKGTGDSPTDLISPEPPTRFSVPRMRIRRMEMYDLRGERILHAGGMGAFSAKAAGVSAGSYIVKFIGTDNVVGTPMHIAASKGARMMR